MTPAAVAPCKSLAEGLTPATVREAVRRALTHNDYSEKAASITMNVDQAQLSRGLSGDGHLYLDRIVALGPAFQRTFVEAWAEALGLRVVSSDTTRDNLRRLMHAMTDCLASLEDR